MIVTKKKAEKLLRRRLKGRANSYYVLSETGRKNLGGPYTKRQAEARLRAVEYFKHAHASNPRGIAPQAGDRVAFTPTTFEMYYYGAQGLEPGDLGTIMATNPYKDPNANVTVQWDKGMVVRVPHEAIGRVSGPKRNPARNTMVTSAAGNPVMDPFGVYQRNPAPKQPGLVRRVAEGALVGGLSTLGLRALGVASNPRAMYDVWYRLSPQDQWQVYERGLIQPAAEQAIGYVRSSYTLMPDLEVRMVDAGAGPEGGASVQGGLFGNPLNYARNIAMFYKSNPDIRIPRNVAIFLLKYNLLDPYRAELMNKEYGDDEDWVGIMPEEWKNMELDPAYKTWELTTQIEDPIKPDYNNNPYNVWLEVEQHSPGAAVEYQNVYRSKLARLETQDQATSMTIGIEDQFMRNRMALTKRQVMAMFKAHVLPSIKRRYEADGRVDHSARRQAWNNYTDMLAKDGQISMRQYNDWSNPF